ncbi:DUF5686 and carboxypeptidase regulatory-like domain-containing protein [uncultured Hymenobacter sp.]|uniref:DUF5686 and carboxypeptidase regulatory-like domain-containing protein n=1 Tax=uncultured Hymenobacter sp. TaxID=170016 RepID=UPI0035CB36B9
MLFPKPFYFPLLVLLMLVAGPARAGLVKGQVTGASQEALPFANVAVRGAATSTGTNEQGRYALRLAPGQYELVFQYVGYRPQTAAVRVLGGDSVTVLNVQLTPEAYNLGEVTVRSSDKDPAYAIIQQAQQWRAYHQREVAAFRARSYIKSLLRFNETPGKVLGLIKVGPDIKPGIFYLSETLSDISFRQPDVVKEHMLSSRVSGDSRGISFNRASAGRNLGFYQNVMKPGGLSERGFISPIAANALLFYRYELVGSSTQGGELVHKIRVIPRRANDPTFSGFLYIIDGSWRIHSVDLHLGPNAGVEYVSDLHIQQLYAPAPGAPHVWVIQSQKLTASFSAFGFKGTGYVNAVLSDYSRVVPTYPAPPATQTPTPPAGANAAATVAPPTTTELTKEIRRQKPQLRGLSRAVRQQVKKAGRDSLRNDPLARMKTGEVQLVEKGVNERDTAYWSQIRPVPLTDEEARDYQVKDSTEAIRSSRPYQDSLDRKRNQLDYKALLLTGYTYRNTFAQRSISVAALTNIIQYNTVEGVVANAQATFAQRSDDRRFFTLTPALRYGFSSQELNPSLSLAWQLDPARLRQVGLTAGRTIENFDRNTQLTPAINSLYTLYRNRNYAKLYRREGLELNYATEPLNGLTLRAAASYFRRYELQNETERLITDVKGRAFTSNQPVAEELPGGTGFGRSDAATVSLSVDFRPGTRYINRPDGKFNLGSKYPTFNVQGRAGLPVLGADVRYVLLQAGLRDNFSLGLFGRSAYRVAVGGFVNSPRDLPFMDYRHFSGNQTILAADFSQFQLLDYYRFSSRHRYVEGHFDHHFNGFILNKVPLLRRLKWQEVATVNYLHTAQAGHYLELGLGIEHIFKLLRVDFFTGLQSGQRVGTGVRVGLGF